MSRARVLPLLVAFAAAVTAPDAIAQHDREQTQLELQRAQRALQQSRSETDRLLEMRLRHDLGIAPASQADQEDRTFRPAAPVTTETIDKLNQEWRDEDAAAHSLRERYNKLRVQVEQLRAEADARTRAAEAGEQPFVQVPVTGSAAPTPRPLPRPGDKPAAPGANEPPAAPAGEVGTGPSRAADPSTLDPALDPLRAQIHGSRDHVKVAQSLFRAGQALMDRAAVAREQRQDALAKDLDDRGKDRLRRALDELAPLVEPKRTPFEVLFLRGKALEALLRHAERVDGLVSSQRDWQRREQEVRDAFLEITARDVQKGGPRGDLDVLGPWGRAAQAALEHFRWMNLNAGYDARATIEALTWPGEKEQ
jgi:hypothetical protein